jgi:hypothetical protein
MWFNLLYHINNRDSITLFYSNIAEDESIVIVFHISLNFLSLTLNELLTQVQVMSNL